MRLVSPSTGSKFGRIFQSSKFNITKLAPRHTRELLKMRPNVATSNEERDKWLAAFWKFWNRNTFGPESPDVEKLDAELLRATVNGVVLYVKPADFIYFRALWSLRPVIIRSCVIGSPVFIDLMPN